MTGLRNGVKQAKGGRRLGAGRKPNWLMAKCRDVIVKNDLIGFLSNVAVGKETMQVVTKSGDVVDILPNIHDRLKALEMLLDRGFGKSIAFDPSELIPPLQKVINDTQLLKTIYGLNYPDRAEKSGSDKAIVAGGASPLQAGK